MSDILHIIRYAILTNIWLHEKKVGDRYDRANCRVLENPLPSLKIMFHTCLCSNMHELTRMHYLHAVDGEIRLGVNHAGLRAVTGDVKDTVQVVIAGRANHSCNQKSDFKSFLPLANHLSLFFNLYSAVIAIEQWEFFIVSHILWHGASVHNGHHHDLLSQKILLIHE